MTANERNAQLADAISIVIIRLSNLRDALWNEADVDDQADAFLDSAALILSAIRIDFFHTEVGK